MSLVGPRPQRDFEVAQYDRVAERRLTVRPGMTGLWQVSGRSDLAYAEAINLDVHYVENWSMMADLVDPLAHGARRRRLRRRLLATPRLALRNSSLVSRDQSTADVALRALLVTPSFFGYEQDIVDEMELQGWVTTLLDERPSNRALTRAVLRVRKKWLGKFVDSYYRRWLTANADIGFDLVVVVKAEVVPKWFLQELRMRNKNARFVFYTYDSLGNAGNCLEVLECFDEHLSFDRRDVETRDEFRYLPLFYTSDFAPGPVALGADFRLAFIGTLHSERYAFAQASFRSDARNYGFFFVQAKWYFFFLKHITRRYATVPWEDVSFTPLTRKQIADVFQKSHAVLDVQRDGQEGLTMRTFEVLASGAILVTTNEAIRREPFFDPRSS